MEKCRIEGCEEARSNLAAARNQTQRLCDTHFRAARAEYMQRYQRRQRAKVLDLLGNKCARCGFNDERALQIDHINGGGNHDARTKGSGWHHLYKRVMAALHEYQILCANCNWIKRHENDENKPFGVERNPPRP